MATLEQTQQAYEILRNYNGDNHYMIYLKNGVYAYRNITLNDLQTEFIIINKDFSPKPINKIVSITDWYGEKRKEEWNLEFIPEKLYITWLMGQTEKFYLCYVIYRQSQEKAVQVFIPKTAVITDFLSTPYREYPVDFAKYNGVGGRYLKPHQMMGIRFLCARERCILADEPGAGKTTQAIVAALESGYKHILIMCPASVKDTWKKELSIYVPDENDSVIVNGSKWKDSRFTIINYDILHNFYEVPTAKMKVKTIDVDDNGNLKATYKEREVISNRKKIVDAAMSNSQLFQSKFDLIIIDEAHKLSNNTSQRYKIVSDLVKRSNPRGIYAVTGTPVTNRPINFFNILKIIGHPLTLDWKKFVERFCDGKWFYNKTERNAYTQNFLKQVGKSTWYELTDKEKEKLDDILDKNCKKRWKTDGASHMEELRERIKNCYLRREKEEFAGMVPKSVDVIHYDLSPDGRTEYNQVWEDYKTRRVELANAEGRFITEREIIDTLDDSRLLIEGTILRQWIARKMIPYTVSLAKTCIERGEKVVIFCAYDEELYTLQETFKDMCVIHNGKMTPKKKTASIDAFQTDPNVMVFIGNINSAGVGITLTAGNNCIFNSFSWTSGDNLQAMDRVHRLSQDKPVNVMFQLFNDTFYEDMFTKVMKKQEIVDSIIISERKKGLQ